jgi:hypothetical protein
MNKAYNDYMEDEVVFTITVTVSMMHAMIR